MPDLSSQLREYFDATAPAQELDTILTDDVWVESTSQTRRWGRTIPAWAYGLGALVLVLVVALGVNLLIAGDQNEAVEPTPTTVPSPDSMATGWWPQSSLEEVQDAQERADAGDPDFTWQVDPALTTDDPSAPSGAEIALRFIEEELGWEEYLSASSIQLAVNGTADGSHLDVVFIRCVPGETNSSYAQYADAPLAIRDCAPTIDEFSYETVRFDLTQPGRRGLDGIWVVEGWEMMKPAEPNTLSSLIFPGWGQVMQVAPPSDTEVTALLEAFVGARIDGEGAERYLLGEPDGSWYESMEVPLLYATSSGASYERFEIEHVQGPVWPRGWSVFEVRLFAEGGTVVEQSFHVVPEENGPLGLVYGLVETNPDLGGGLPTTEDGQPVAQSYSFLDGEVTFAATPPWGDTQGIADPSVRRLHGGRVQNFVIAADPRPTGLGCEDGPAPANAESLARAIMADPAFEATEPVAVRVAGVDGLLIDAMVADSPDLCYLVWTPDHMIPAGDTGWRLRLYLIDYPGDSAEVLTIGIIAPQSDSQGVFAAATPIVESLEIHTP
jgi:hypothetical protein